MATRKEICAQPDLGEMELKRVISTQADVEARLEKVGERISFVSQEQGVVAQRAHRESNLFQIKEILQGGDFAK
jgi:hypothetical protein